MLAQSAISTFRVRFNYLNGTNIQLALYANEDQCESIAKNLDKHFVVFFSNATFKEESFDFPCQSLFISFPQNSIQYGLYELDAAIEKDRNNLHQLLSEIIIDSLQNNIDDTSLITLALYLHLAVIQVFNNLPNLDAANLNSLFLDKYPITPGASDSFESFFTENKDSLLEILEDVFTRNFTEEDELFWLTRWKRFCKSELSKKEKPHDELYRLWAATIDNFLGFNMKEKQFFNGLMYKTIELKFNCITAEIIA
jgi:hypothetical protein